MSRLFSIEYADALVYRTVDQAVYVLSLQYFMMHIHL
jgi:hypothetical protein